MKKINIIILLMAINTLLFAQEAGSHLTISGGAGATKFNFKLKELDSFGKNKVRLGGLATIGYSYYFSQNWGISTGVGFSYYEGYGKYESPFSKDNYFNLGNQIDDDFISGSSRNYELRARLANWEERQSGYFIEIPLTLNFQYKFGEEKRHGIYAALGVKAQIPVQSQFKVIDNMNAQEGGLNVTGYYPDEGGLEMGLYSISEVNKHGFGVVHNPNERLGWNGKTDIKNSFAVTGEFGFLIGMGKRVDFTLGVYLDYGFNDIKGSGSNATLMEAPEHYLPNANDNTGGGIKYNGMINSNRTDRVNLISYGGKAGIRIKLGKLASDKKLEDEAKKQRELDEANKRIADSLEKLMKDMQDRLNQLSNTDTRNDGMATIKGMVLDSKTRQPLSATVELNDPVSNKVLAAVVSNATTGEYLFTMPVGSEYVINANKEGYIYYTDKIDIPATEKAPVINKVIVLDKIEVDRTVVLKNIFFDFGKATLRPESLGGIDNIYRLMMENPTVELEISGHTDNVGSAAYNRKLSLERAEAVVNVLVEKGVSRSRLISKGYGFDRPADTNSTPEGRAANRRTEFKIIKE